MLFFHPSGTPIIWILDLLDANCLIFYFLLFISLIFFYLVEAVLGFIFEPSFYTFMVFFFSFLFFILWEFLSYSF